MFQFDLEAASLVAAHDCQKGHWPFLVSNLGLRFGKNWFKIARFFELDILLLAIQPD